MFKHFIYRFVHSELTWIVGSTLILFILSYAPIIRTFHDAPSNLWYWGAEEYPLDLTGNLSTIRQGYNGHWTATLNYSSTISVPRSLVKIEYIFIGQIARLFRMDSTLTFFIVRFLLSLAYLSVIYALIRSLFASKRERVVAWFFVLFAACIMRPGDYGFFYTAVVDVLVTHRLLLTMPHYLLGSICGLASILFLSKAIDQPKDIRSFLSASTLGMIAALVYGPMMIMIVVTLPIFVAIRFIQRKRIVALAGVIFAYAVLVDLPLLYVGWVTDVAWESFRAISHIEKLNPFRVNVPGYLLAVGLVYILALVGLPAVIKKGKTLPVLLASWVVVHPIATFFLSAPLGLNMIRFFLTPYFVVFGVLAVFGVRQIAGWVPKRWTEVLTVAIVIAVFSSSVIAYQANYNKTRFCFCMQPHLSFAYPPKSFMGGIWWLRDNTKENDTVLSLYLAGNLIPAFAGNRVYLSWWFRLAELPTLSTVWSWADGFYSGGLSGSVAKQFLAREHISYVFWGPEERTFAPQLSDLPYPFLRQVYNREGVVVYRVVE